MRKKCNISKDIKDRNILYNRECIYIKQAIYFSVRMWSLLHKKHLKTINYETAANKPAYYPA
jgi:hypothetical protein